MKPTLPAFDPAEVPESNATTYPEPLRAPNQNRYNRRLGNHVGLKNFGVNITRIVPGGQSSYRHAHSRQDEFVYVLEGEVVLETNAGAQVLAARDVRRLPRRHRRCAPLRQPIGRGRAAAGGRRPQRRTTRSPIPTSTCTASSVPTASIVFTRKDGTPY